MVLPLLLGLAAPLIGGAIRAGGAAAKERAQQAAQAEYLSEYAEYKRNVESTPQITRYSSDLPRLVAAAESAGFNPLTVLQAGGLSAFGVTEAPKLWVPPAPREGFSPGGAGAMAFGESVSNVDLSAAYSNYAQGRLAMSQAAALQLPSRGVSGRSHVAAQRSGGGVITGPVLSTAVLPLSEGVARTPTVETPTVTNPTPAGNWFWHVNPWFADAAAWEERYGEGGDWVGGALTFGADALYNTYRANKFVYSEAYKLGQKAGQLLRSPVEPTPQWPNAMP